MRYASEDLQAGWIRYPTPFQELKISYEHYNCERGALMVGSYQPLCQYAALLTTCTRNLVCKLERRYISIMMVS